MTVRDFLAPGVLVLFLAIAGFVVVTRKPVNRPVQGFTLTITQTTYPSGRDPIHSATKIRQQKSDGNFRVQTTYSNGRVEELFGQPGIGVFGVDAKNKQLDQLSDMPGHWMDVDWKKEPGYVGDVNILGYTTHHIHKESSDGQTVDMYMSKQLPGYPLKIVSSQATYKTVWEVTEVKLGEPSFDPPPAYQVDRSRYNGGAQQE